MPERRVLNNIRRLNEGPHWVLNGVSPSTDIFGGSLPAMDAATDLP
jgi:hypothetical protein